METIGYLAIYSPTGRGRAVLDGIDIPYELEAIQLNHVFQAVNGHTIKLEEEQSRDSERWHLNETVTVLTINGHLFAQDNSSKGSDTIAIRRNSVTPEALSTSQKVIYTIHSDHLGTPQVLTDETGQVVWSARYDPFGQAMINDDPDGDGNRVTFNLRFPGQYYDAETGLHYSISATTDHHTR